MQEYKVILPQARPAWTLLIFFFLGGLVLILFMHILRVGQGGKEEDKRIICPFVCPEEKMDFVFSLNLHALWNPPCLRNTAPA